MAGLRPLATQHGSSTLVFGALLLISFLGLGRPLWTPDEPREAEISREMLLAPTVVPTLNGRRFIEKPPLYYWAVASVYGLSGSVSPAAARTVGSLSAFLTLLMVYFWGRREFSTAVGVVAALGLATSSRFLIATHWILIDPFLMLFTTIAVVSGWRLLESGRASTAAVFYGALALALWTKGLVGPVLVGGGIALYCACHFRQAPWRRLHLGLGAAVMAAALGLLGLSIYATAGADALREWFWINHVMRFVDPQGTGHGRPLTYYLWALPVAVLPWWIGAAEALRPRNWRGSGNALERYLGLMVLGMAVILSLSATKRENYLLPLLPPLFLLLAAFTVRRWDRVADRLSRSVAWWLQLALCASFALGPVLLVVFYYREVNPAEAVFLSTVIAAILATIVLTIVRRRFGALLGLCVCAIAGGVGLIVVGPAEVNRAKNMEPFLMSIDSALPAGEPLYALGHVDETLEGIIPFTTGRELREISLGELADARPAFLLVQDVDGRDSSRGLPAGYQMVLTGVFSDERELSLWRDATGSP